MIIGLTGQSGAGKSTVSEILRLQQDFAVIDCDSIARDVTEDGSICNKAIKEQFPEAVSDELVLDRKKIASIVFSDKELLRKYEGIIYPFITAQVTELISLYSFYGYRAIILDAPTLFEAGLDTVCDFVISVIADKSVRAERIRQRDKIDDEMIEKRFAAQRNDEFFKEHSEFIIYNNSDHNELERQTKEILNTIRNRING